MEVGNIPVGYRDTKVVCDEDISQEAAAVFCARDLGDEDGGNACQCCRLLERSHVVEKE